MTAASSPPVWGNIIAAISTFVATTMLIGAIGSLVISPIREHQAHIDAEIDKINMTMAPLLTLYAQHTSDLAVIASIQKELDAKLDRNVFDVTSGTVQAKIDTSKADTLRSFDEITHQVHSLEADIVTRAENAQHWADISDRISALERHLDAVVAATAVSDSPRRISGSANPP